jgi:uncharacterized protein involved in propanediol utilization
LPAPSLRAEAVVRQASRWSVWPPRKTKALAAARLAAEHWGWTGQAMLCIRSAIPIGRGYGSSTADCTAAIRAIGVMAGVDAADEDVARLAARAELASDSTMFGMQPVAFLPLLGRCLRRLDGGWPDDLAVETVDLGGPPVDTCGTRRPDYTAAELDEFAWLLREAESAFARRDGTELARIATRSAEIHMGHRPHRNWEWLRRLAHAKRALGVAIAHSGTGAAILTRSTGRD